FNPVELCARVRSQLRRYMQLGGGKEDDAALMIGPVSLDEKAKEVARDGEVVSLTPTEYEILRFLMRHAGEVFSPRELYRRVWNGEPYGAENTVSVHIRHIREKLEVDPAEPRWIKAVWGQGYKFERSGK
ncbi:MAG: response regulator transcription factor, partial [Oscillospiraceae bacterium]|nr:response regulator transcription factor [Oscillospiraceae bacterium]